MSNINSENREVMSFSELVAWAWRETPPVHKNAMNLVIHILAVPLFVFGHVLALTGAVVAWQLAIAGVVCIVFSISIQGFGHSLEQQQVDRFTGPRDFLRRLYAEQFYNFWRFLFSGRWHASLKTREKERIA